MNHRKLQESQIDPDVQSHIGRQLRAGYIDILNQPVPDRFLDLLAELDRRQEGAEGGEGAAAQNDGAR